MDAGFCNGCVYFKMCGRKREVMLTQDKVSQMVKRDDKIFNFTGCLDRKLEDGATGVIRILIDGVDIEKGESDVAEETNTAD